MSRFLSHLRASIRAYATNCSGAVTTDWVMLSGTVLLGTSLVIAAFGGAVGSALTSAIAEQGLGEAARSSEQTGWLPRMPSGRSYLSDLDRSGGTRSDQDRRPALPDDGVPDPGIALYDRFLIEHSAPPD